MKTENIVRSNAVAKLVKDGALAANSASDNIREAAAAFVTLIQKAKIEFAPEDVATIVSHGKLLYNEEFSIASNADNIKRIFTDYATLGLLPNAQISYENSKKEEVHIDGKSATTLPVGQAMKAATALRQDLGIGRKAGGGRKAQTPTKAPVQLVFSLTELKSQFAGLFGHSKDAVSVLNTALAEYHCAVVSSADLEAFNKWKAKNTKQAA